MKIGFNFHTSDSYISGVEYYSLGLLRSLLDTDHKNQYVVFTNRPGLVGKQTGSRDNLTIRDCSFLKSRLARINWEHLRLPSLAQREGLDVLHCPHYICPAIKCSVPYVITIHDTFAVDCPGWCKRTNAAYYGMFMSRAIKNASRIAAVSKSTFDQIHSNFNVNDSKVHITHPGVEMEVFNSVCDSQENDRVKAKYELGEKYILYCGNIEPKKNILNLLRAFKLLREKGFQHELVITGGRNWRSKNVFDFLRTEFKPKQVNLVGHIKRSDLAVIYKMADCVVLPSFCEGFGFPVPEALAAGVPVMASWVGVVKEIDNGAYSILRPDNPQQIAKTTERLLLDDNLRESQIKKGAKEVQRFRWSNCAAKTLKLYREAVELN